MALTFTVQLLAQSGINKSINSNPATTCMIAKHEVLDNYGSVTSTSYESGGFNIGHQEILPDRYTYRTGYQFNIPSIPSNAINIAFKLTVSVNPSGTGTCKIVQLSNSQSFSYSSAPYNAIGSGTDLVSHNCNNSTLEHDITSFVVSKQSAGYFKIGALLDSYSYASLNISLKTTYTVPVEITAATNFGGSLYVDGDEVASGTTIYKWIGETISFSPKEQTLNNYDWIWNDIEAPLYHSKWEDDKVNYTSTFDPSETYSFSITAIYDGAEITAHLKKICDLDFAVSSSKPSIVNSIRVNSATYSTPTQDFEIVEENTIHAEAPMFYDNTEYIYYYFDVWDDANTQASRTITAANHKTYTAYYKGYATTSGMNVHFDGSAGDPITIDWDDHPCSDVTQYKVYRYPGTLLATLNRGTTSCTDNTYTYYDGMGTSVNLKYAVTAYYSPDETW